MNQVFHQVEWGVNMAIGDHIGDSIWNSIMGTKDSHSQHNTTNDNTQVPLKKLKSMNKMWKQKMKECNNTVSQLKQQLQTMQQQPMVQQYPGMQQYPDTQQYPVMQQYPVTQQYPVMVQGSDQDKRSRQSEIERRHSVIHGGKKRKSMKKKTKRKSRKH